jgi:hypothetical protein
LKESANGLIDVVTNPVGTASGLWKAISHPVETFNYIFNKKCSNSEERCAGSIVGQVAGSIATAGVGAPALSIAQGMGSAGKVVDAADAAVP